MTWTTFESVFKVVLEFGELKKMVTSKAKVISLLKLVFIFQLAFLWQTLWSTHYGQGILLRINLLAYNFFLCSGNLGWNSPIPCRASHFFTLMYNKIWHFRSVTYNKTFFGGFTLTLDLVPREKKWLNNFKNSQVPINEETENSALENISLVLQRTTSSYNPL